MVANYALRWATGVDYPALADVMFDAVRNGPSAYTDAQRRQWVPDRRQGPDWTARLDQQAIVLAEDSENIAAFMSLADQVYIDFAFVRPHAQRQGLFKQLYAAIEQRSRVRGDTRLWTHASLMARPAFAAVGFSVVERQIVTIGQEQFERFEMEKMAFSAPVAGEGDQRGRACGARS